LAIKSTGAEAICCGAALNDKPPLSDRPYLAVTPLRCVSLLPAQKETKEKARRHPGFGIALFGRFVEGKAKAKAEHTES